MQEVLAAVANIYDPTILENHMLNLIEAGGDTTALSLYM